MAPRWHPRASEHSLCLNYERHTPASLLSRSAFSRSASANRAPRDAGSLNKRVNSFPVDPKLETSLGYVLIVASKVLHVLFVEKTKFSRVRLTIRLIYALLPERNKGIVKYSLQNTSIFLTFEKRHFIIRFLRCLPSQ